MPFIKKISILPLATILFLLYSTFLFAQSNSFVQKFRPLADSLESEFGIPAAIILGISMIESGSGTSRNVKLLNNYFGIVGKNNILKTHGIRSRYKQYPDANSSFRDFCNLQVKKKYYSILKGNMNYKIWIEYISKSGYSEMPSVWKQRVNNIIIKSKLDTPPK